MSFSEIQLLFTRELKDRLPQLIIGSFVVFLFAYVFSQFMYNKTFSSRITQAADSALEAIGVQKAAEPQPSEPKNETVTYTVVRGDSLWNIAEKEYGNGFLYQEIAKANNIKNPSHLIVGMRLVLPQLKADVSGDLVPVAAQTVKTDGENYHTVSKGEHLWQIAISYYGNGYGWSAIAKANNLKNPDILYAGQRLIIPPTP